MKRLLFALLFFNFHFSAVQAEIAFVPQTGQTKCYDNNGHDSPCAGTGQDGDSQMGIPWPSPRFKDNTDGTMTDNLTGLIWLKNASCFYSDTWANSITAASNLKNGICGLKDNSNAGDWRLPNLNELKSLIHWQESNPASWLNRFGFAFPSYNNFWSSSTSASNTGYAWSVAMTYGQVTNDLKSSHNAVLPVRSGPPPAAVPATGQTVSYATADDGALRQGLPWPNPRFTDLNDGTILDNLTGLVWLKVANCFDRQVWQTAITAVNGLKKGVCGLADGSKAGDWRLPNVAQLQSLADLSRFNPASPVGHPFINFQTDSYWSSSTMNSKNYAWHISMYDGGVDYIFGGTYNYVWPVRSGQYWALDALIIGAPTSALSFGEWPVGAAPATKQISLRNKGTGPIIATLALDNTNGPDFTVSPGGDNPCANISPTLAGGASCTLLVSFAPKTVDVQNAKLSVTINGKSVALPLKGMGVALLPAPTRITATFGDSQVGIRWNAALGATSYNIYYSTTPGVTKATGIKIANVTNPYTVTSLSNGTQYYFVATAVNSGLESVESEQISVKPTIPAIPGRALVPRTGQPKSYTTGDDGDTLMGVPWPSQRFTDNADGTMTDNLTGLIWLKNASCANMKWTDAIAWSNNLATGSCGLTDNSKSGEWRLPNRNELMSLHNMPVIGVTSWLKDMGFTTVSQYYWSSSTYPFDTDFAWYTDMLNGDEDSSNKADSYAVWPVRSGPPPAAGIQLPATGQLVSYATADDGALRNGVVWPSPRFTDLNDGTILDNLTGLIWLKNASCVGNKTWENALTAANGLKSGTCGLTDGTRTGDWRLPNVLQLKSLMDLNRNPRLPVGQPFINAQMSYWSSTSSAFSNFFWYVDMDYGATARNWKDYSYYVWPVLSGQFWALDSLLIGSPAADLSFGELILGVAPVTKQISLRNKGTTSIVATVTVSTKDGPDFSVVPGGDSPCASISPTLAVGSSCTLLASFAPLTAGAQNATLALSANGKSVVVPLNGTGVLGISGRVKTAAGTGVAGVSFSGATCTTTDSTGTYSCTVPSGWSGSLTPLLGAYSYTPAFLSYTGVVSNQTGQDYLAVVLPFDGSFEGTGWQTAQVLGTLGQWSIVSEAYLNITPHGGARMASFNSYNAIFGQTRIYWPIGMTISSNSTLNFWMYHDTGSSSNDRIQVQVSTDGNTWSNVGSTISRYSGNNGWARASIDLSAYSGQTVFLGFLGIGANGKDMYLDDVNIEVTTLTDIMSSGPATVNESGSAVYVATASWSDGSSTTINPIWSVSPTTYASIDIATGILTTKAVLSSQPITVSASFTSGGVTKTVNKNVSIVNVTASLTVSLMGNGSGSVNSVPSGAIVCSYPPQSGVCDTKLAISDNLKLIAAVDTLSNFNGWTGSDCSGKVDCTVTAIAGDLNVNATFTAADRARISSFGYSSLNDAYIASATTGITTILTLDALLKESLMIDKNLVILGGYNANYTSRNGSTTLEGKVTIGKGSLVVDRVVIR